MIGEQLSIVDHIENTIGAWSKSPNFPSILNLNHFNRNFELICCLEKMIDSIIEIRTLVGAEYCKSFSAAFHLFIPISGKPGRWKIAKFLYHQLKCGRCLVSRLKSILLKEFFSD